MITFAFLIFKPLDNFPELEFSKSLWGLGTEEEEGYRTGPPGYLGWRNSFLGIDSGAPYTFKNTGSGVLYKGGKKLTQGGQRVLCALCNVHVYVQ